MTTTIETVLGFVVLEEQDNALVALRFADQGALGGTSPLARRVRAYFDERDLAAFDGVEIEPRGTAFQRAVWEKVRKIPAGATRSYGELARDLGSPGASRAVGAANGANPICLVIPCHRVIGAGGKLTGYAYGLERKRWLLEHERGAGSEEDRRGMAG